MPAPFRPHRAYAGHACYRLVEHAAGLGPHPFFGSIGQVARFPDFMRDDLQWAIAHLYAVGFAMAKSAARGSTTAGRALYAVGLSGAGTLAVCTDSAAGADCAGAHGDGEADEKKSRSLAIGSVRARRRSSPCSYGVRMPISTP